MREPASRAPRRVARAAVPILVALVSALAFAQSPPPQGQGSNPFWGSGPPKQANPFGSPLASPPPRQATATPPQATSPVIARIEGRDVTQADFDRIALPYFAQLRAQFGPGFDATMQRTASLNVLDELVKRELLAIESQRQKLEVSQAETDKLLSEDPFFLTNGKFDPAKLETFKTDPRSNYPVILPRLRETAAMRKLDESLRQRFKPTAAQVRAEWSKRSDQLRLSMLPLLTREMPTEPEAPPSEWEPYYKAHPDQFARRARVRLRYMRLPLPVEGDSTRAAEEKHAMARARAIADSLRRGAMPDSAAELTDTGLFEIPAPVIPGLGRVAGLIDTLAKAEDDAKIRVVGPYVTSDGVFVGVIAERQAKQVPPFREVMGDAKRRADVEHRRVANEAERRAYFDAHRDHWRGTRMAITRVTVRAAALEPKPPTIQEIDRWYAEHGRRLFGKSDSSRAWVPPISDSLRAAVRARLLESRRAEQATQTLSPLVEGLRGKRDPRALAKAAGASVETLSVLSSSADSLWRTPFVDSLLGAGMAAKGTVQGPRAFGGHWAVWRVDAVDTAFVPTYELARVRSDLEFAREKARKDSTEARAYFEGHRSEFKAPVRYALEMVTVNGAPPESVAVTEAEMRRHYEANRSSYQQEEQVKARHILFSTRGATPETEKKAKERADSLVAAIRKRSDLDFEALAKAFSQEPSASATGGDLGWFGRKRMVKEFEDAAFALKPGEISGVVKTIFGYHIIKVEDRKAAGVKPFIEVRSDLRTEMAQARADTAALRKANGLRRRLALGEAKAAAPYGGVRALDPIAASDPLPGIGFAQGLAQDLPSMAAGRWASKAYKAGTKYVVVRLARKIPEHPAEFDEARPQVTAAVMNEKRRAALAEKAKAIRDALAAGQPIDSVAAPYGGLKDSGFLMRASTFLPYIGLEPRVVEKAFAAKLGVVSDTLQIAQGVVWLRVDDRKSADPAGYAASSASIESELLKKRYDAWVEEKRKGVRIEVLRPDLKGPRSVAALNP